MPGRSRAVPITVVLSLAVAAGAFAVAFTQRPDRAADDQASASEPSCRQVSCSPVATAPVAGGAAELRANVDGTVGALRVPGGQRFDIAVTERGATLAAGSLVCAEGEAPACLVSGKYPDGRIADVFVANAGVWSRSDTEITSRNGYLGLHDATADPGLEVISVQQECIDGATEDCAEPLYFAQVFSLSGNTLGCTHTVAKVSSLPDAPNVAPEPENVHECK